LLRIKRAQILLTHEGKCRVRFLAAVNARNIGEATEVCSYASFISFKDAFIVAQKEAASEEVHSHEGKDENEENEEVDDVKNGAEGRYEGSHQILYRLVAFLERSHNTHNADAFEASDVNADGQSS
jgi:hypothetical protein